MRAGVFGVRAAAHRILHPVRFNGDSLHATQRAMKANHPMHEILYGEGFIPTRSAVQSMSVRVSPLPWCWAHARFRRVLRLADDGADGAIDEVEDYRRSIAGAVDAADRVGIRLGQERLRDAACPHFGSAVKCWICGHHRDRRSRWGAHRFLHAVVLRCRGFSRCARHAGRELLPRHEAHRQSGQLSAGDRRERPHRRGARPGLTDLWPVEDRRLPQLRLEVRARRESARP